jgi:hypothetical protein
LAHLSNGCYEVPERWEDLEGRSVLIGAELVDARLELDELRGKLFLTTVP